MREPKQPDDEMLIVHKSPLAADPRKLGRNPAATPAKDDQRVLERLRRRLSRTTDAGRRRELLARIQREFGNDQAAAALRELRGAPTDDSPPARPKRPTKGKA